MWLLTQCITRDQWPDTLQHIAYIAHGHTTNDTEKTRQERKKINNSVLFNT